MEFIGKYIITLFAVENIMAINRLIGTYATPFLYVILGIGLIYIIWNSNTAFNVNSQSTYTILYFYIFIIWIYQLIFGWDHIHPKTWTYLISKTVMLLMTVVAISNNPDFHLRKFYIIICYFTTILIIYGAIVSPLTSTGRFSLGFGNPNGLGSLSAICFGYLFIAEDAKMRKNIKIFMLSVLLIAVLLSGSRASLGAVIIAVVYKYGLSFKILLIGCLTTIIFFVILPSYNITFQGIDRFVNTVESQNFSSGREQERAATILMIQNSPWEGNGIYAGQSEEAMRISELGSHNAYLDILKWFGYPIGLTLIAAILICAFRNFRIFWNSNIPEFRAHLFVIIAVLIISLYEGLIHGVNEIINTLFFVSFAVLDYYRKAIAEETVTITE